MTISTVLHTIINWQIVKFVSLFCLYKTEKQTYSAGKKIVWLTMLVRKGVQGLMQNEILNLVTSDGVKWGCCCFFLWRLLKCCQLICIFNFKCTKCPYNLTNITEVGVNSCEIKLIVESAIIIKSKEITFTITSIFSVFFFAWFSFFC